MDERPLATPPRALPTADGCPAPVSAAQVLETFRCEARPWELDRSTYRTTGRTWGEGSPLYLLGGALGNCELFAPLAYLLRDSFRFVFVDYPSGTPVCAPTLADDVLAAADRHGDRQFDVLATGMGGLVALAALHRSSRIRRAVLHAAYARRRLSVVERLLAGIGRWLPGRIGGIPLWGRIQAQNHHAWFPPFDEIRWPFYLENASATPTADLARRAALVGRSDLRPALAGILQPVLLVRTEGEGRVAAAAQDELARRLPNARTEWLHTAGHLAYLTHPHRVAKLVRSFLDPTAPSAAPVSAATTLSQP